MSEQQIKYSIPRVAYFDPNNYGKAGYSMISLLLLLFEKVIISNICSYNIEACYQNHDLKTTSLTLQEFYNYTFNEKCIIPLGFETFFDFDSRQRFYPSHLSISDEFDEELITSSLAFELSNKYKFEKSPLLASKLTKQIRYINRISQLMIDEYLPESLINILTGRRPVPDSVAYLLSQFPEENNPQGYTYRQIGLTAAMAAYDYYNNEYAISSYSKVNQKMEVLRIQSIENLLVYKSLISFLYPKIWKNNWNINLQFLIDQVLKSCLKEITKKENWRLTSEIINDFRVNHQKAFIKFITSQIIEVFENPKNTDDVDKRREDLDKKISVRFEQLRQDIDSGLINILHQVIITIFYAENPLNISQQHYGNGDNIAGNNVTNIYYNAPVGIVNQGDIKIQDNATVAGIINE